MTRLRELCQTIRFALWQQPWRPPSTELLDSVRQAWTRGIADTGRLVRQRNVQLPLRFDCEDWDGFRTRPVEWAMARGFPNVATDWSPGNAVTAVRPPSASSDLANDLDLLQNSLDISPPLTAADGQAILDQALEWKKVAKSMRAAVWRHGSADRRQNRAGALRAQDLRLWCRMLRPARRPQATYSPDRVLLEDGTAQIPVNVEQAKLGAAQEWKPLHQGPVPRWEHQCLTFWRDAIGNQRASPNLLSIAAAAPGSDLRRLGLAYLLPGLVEITDCAGGDIVRVEQGAIHTKSLCLQCTEGKWTAQRLQFSLDVQRECGMRADHSSWALQINVAKPKGGWRPLTMLEETFKAVEGPVTRRLTQWRSRMEPGCLYSDLNRAYEVGVSAAPLVLYLDAMIVEDAFFWRRDICRVAADYEKFFNAVTLAASDAVMQARAVPPEVRRLYTAAFSGIKLRVQTRWGPSLPILVSRGLPQGSVSAPELSKAAQDPLLRLRERSDAAYTTSAGLKVGAAGYVDDTEHYADGARQLQLMTADLRLGSEGTGIGFCWPKCSAFATDWLPYMRHAAPPRREINEMGVLAGGWDIWHGGVAEATIPRAHEDTQETLLGKLGTLRDRHSAGAGAVRHTLHGRAGQFSGSEQGWWCTVALSCRECSSGGCGS